MSEPTVETPPEDVQNSEEADSAPAAVAEVKQPVILSLPSECTYNKAT